MPILGLDTSTRTAVLAGALIFSLLPGCPADDEGEDGASSDGSSGSGGTSTSSTSTSASGTSTSTSTTSADSSGGATGEDSSSGAGSSSGSESGVSGCAMYDDQLECMMAGCTPVVGSEYMMMGDMVCLGPRTLIECQENMACDQVVTVACDPNDMPYQFPNSCIPAGWMECDPPADNAPACG